MTASNRRLRALDSVLRADHIGNRLFGGSKTSRAAIVTIRQVGRLISVGKVGD